MHPHKYICSVVRGRVTVKEVLWSVMWPEYSGYNRQVTISKCGKGKHRASSASLALKAKRMPTFKF